MLRRRKISPRNSLMKLLSVLSLIGCLYTPVTWSQCAPGLDGCPPPDAPGWGAGATPVNVTSAQPRAIWADHWGALAIDGGTGQAGFVADRASKSEAVNDAMNGCKMHGSPHCELLMSYHNSCIALAWGTHYLSWNAATESESKSRALSRCNDLGISGCRIVYSACSFAERIK
jgi:hypothetical protein